MRHVYLMANNLGLDYYGLSNLKYVSFISCPSLCFFFLRDLSFSMLMLWISPNEALLNLFYEFMPGMSSCVTCELHMCCVVMCHVPKNEWASYSGNACVSSIGTLHAKSTFMPSPILCYLSLLGIIPFHLIYCEVKLMYRNCRFALSMACLSSYVI